MSDSTPAPALLATSLKLKLGVTVTLSVLVATLVGTLGSQAGVPPWLSVPVTVGLALMVTQLLAAGLTAPLRQMTEAARAMARGEYDGRVQVTTADEVGELGRAFNSMAEELATVDRDRRELIANVAHEVRTPLTALGAVLENLADGVVPADADHLAEARDQAERLARLVDSLLDLSRLEAGATSAQWEPVRVVDLLTRSARTVETLGRGVPIEVSVTPSDLVVSGDSARLAQLVSNLLDNATRHSPAGEVVSVRAGRRGADPTAGAWWLEVADRGPGVPLEDREPAFARFRTMSGDHGGTGLGLAIVRWVATLHGGTVAFVDPASGDSGARVRAEFPAPAPTSHPPAPTSHPPAPTSHPPDDLSPQISR